MFSLSPADPLVWKHFTNRIGEGIHEGNIVDKIYLARKNKNVVDNFGVQRAHAALDETELEYMVDLGPVSGSTSANYVYASFFNPSGSGKYAVIKRIAVRANAVAAANYVNLSVRRISSASGGTQISAANIPTKNASSTSSILEVRHTGVTVSLSGVTDSRILGQPMPGAAGDINSYRDITFDSSSEKLILQPNEGIVVYQEAAGDADQRIRVYIEWEETASAPSAGDEFLFAFPRVENAASANYVYNSFFNPGASGKTAVVKRIWFGSESCDTTSVYTNNVVLRRTTAASGGTQITASNVPKKNTSSSNSAMEFRHTGATVTAVGGSDARLGFITPCGAAGQPHGWQMIDFATNDEKLILQPGEGIALMSDATGDVDQLNRMIIEWDEVSSGSTPSSQGEYIWASPRVEVAAALNTTFFSFFNPASSTKTMVVKKIGIRVNADLGATYSAFQFRRITAASGGTQVVASDLPKKHTGTANSLTEVRWCGAACGSAITVTYAGTTDSDILQTNGPGAVGQIIGQRELAFRDNEKLVLKSGEGIGMYIDVLAGDVDQYVKMYIEWDEESSAPATANEYLIDIGPVNGNTGTSYNYATFFNPVGSGKTAIVKRATLRVDTIAAGVYVPMQLRRISAASAGTQISAANIPKKNASSTNSIMEIRRTGVTATYSGGSASKLIAITTPGAVGSAVAPSTSGYHDMEYVTDERIILQPGEGLGLYHDTAAGDADLRVKLYLEWEESASTPDVTGDYLIVTGPTTGAAAAGYVYSAFFNPATSSKRFVVKRVGIKANRTGTLVAPGYIPATLRKITSLVNGTPMAMADVPKKHSSASTTSAYIHTANPTVTLANATDTRILGVTAPGVVVQTSGIYSTEFIYGDELVLQPGEGIALYQESAAGDNLLNYHAMYEWSESTIEAATSSPQSLSFLVSTSTIYFGTLASASTRYASSTNSSGDGSEVQAHTIAANTNATSGYTVTVQGQTLTSQQNSANTISALGGTNTSPSIGVEQFGIRATASGGSGTVTSPYAASGFAYAATATTSSQIASASTGDSATTTYSMRYMSNIAPTTEAGNYSASLVYVVTANF